MKCQPGAGPHDQGGLQECFARPRRARLCRRRTKSATCQRRPSSVKLRSTRGSRKRRQRERSLRKLASSKRFSLRRPSALLESATPNGSDRAQASHCARGQAAWRLQFISTPALARVVGLERACSLSLPAELARLSRSRSRSRSRRQPAGGIHFDTGNRLFFRHQPGQKLASDGRWSLKAGRAR